MATFILAERYHVHSSLSLDRDTSRQKQHVHSPLPLGQETTPKNQLNLKIYINKISKYIMLWRTYFGWWGEWKTTVCIGKKRRKNVIGQIKQVFAWGKDLIGKTKISLSCWVLSCKILTFNHHLIICQIFIFLGSGMQLSVVLELSPFYCRC